MTETPPSTGKSPSRMPAGSRSAETPSAGPVDAAMSPTGLPADAGEDLLAASATLHASPEEAVEELSAAGSPVEEDDPGSSDSDHPDAGSEDAEGARSGSSEPDAAPLDAEGATGTSASGTPAPDVPAATPADADPAKARDPAQAILTKRAGVQQTYLGASDAVPMDLYLNPRYIERVPMLEVLETALLRCRHRHPDYFAKHGRLFVAEVGSYRGRGLRAMLEHARILDMPVFITALDSFSGFPELSETDQKLAPQKAKYLRADLFSDTTEREVRAYVGPEFKDSFQLVSGFFEETLPKLVKRKYSFVMMDCDLYLSHKQTMLYFYKKLLPGGIMFFDDYHSLDYPMAKVAIDEFVETVPESLFHISYVSQNGNDVKAYLCKF